MIRYARPITSVLVDSADCEHDTRRFARTTLLVIALVQTRILKRLVALTETDAQNNGLVERFVHRECLRRV